MPSRPRADTDFCSKVVSASAAAGIDHSECREGPGPLSDNTRWAARPSGPSSADPSGAARRDVAKLRLSDICFTTGTVSVRGKGRREVRLPLPQEVGEALLEYLRIGRPQTESDRVFLRVRAPLQAFGGRQIGHAVSHIARAALKRADIQPPTRGAHVFRHTAACQMLRAGVGLEGIAEVFRHRSIETTALYAKVDLHLPEQVAQPWPEVASC